MRPLGRLTRLVRGSPGLSRFAALGGALLPLLQIGPVCYLTSVHRAVEQDDALIYLRYVRNFLAGKGLVYNEGSFYNGLTSSLHTYLLIVVSSLVRDLQRASTLLSGAFLGLAALAFSQVFRRQLGIPFVLFSALLMVCSRYFYATFGMETTVFIFLIGTCLYLFERNRTRGLGIACALLVLTRPEGVFLLVAMAIEHHRQGRPLPRLGDFVLPALIIAANCLFNLVYYGAVLPGTSAAKIYFGMSSYWGEWPTAFLRVGYHFTWYFLSSYFLFLTELFLAVVGVISLRSKSLNVVAISFLALYTAFYVLLNIPNHPWYYGPYYAIGFFWAGAGAQWLWGRLSGISIRSLRVAGATVGVLLLALVLGWNFEITRRMNAWNDRHVPYHDIGLWIRDNTPRDASLAAVEIGTLGWFSERPIIDILGLVSPLNARFVADREMGRWLQHYTPDYVLAHDPPWQLETGISDAAANGYLVEHPTFRYPGYRLFVRRDLVGR